MSPILEQFIQGDKGAFNELIEAIAAHSHHGQAVRLHPGKPHHAGIPAGEVPEDSEIVRPKDVIQRKKGVVQFIF